MWLLFRAVCISGGVLVSLELDSNFNGNLVACDGSFVVHIVIGQCCVY